MKHAIHSDLADSSFMKQGIGSVHGCVRIFDSKQDAEQFAETLIKLKVTPLNPSDFGVETYLGAFQESLESYECFEILPVVE